MKLVLFSHVGLACKDPRITEEFYTKYFGFHRSRALGEGDDQVVFLRAEYSPVMLELFKSKGTSPAPPATGAGPEYPGVRHLAFQVDDVDAKLAEIGDAARVTQPPLDFGAFIPGWRTAWIADPDDRIVEVSQGYTNQS
jgi:glyoxylase I family protein